MIDYSALGNAASQGALAQYYRNMRGAQFIGGMKNTINGSVLKIEDNSKKDSDSSQKLLLLIEDWKNET